MTIRWLTTLLAVLSVALIAAVAVWVLRDDDAPAPADEEPTTMSASELAAAEPTTMSASELANFAAEQDAPVYWLGERSNADYELTDSGSGRIYIRYLTDGADAGDERAKFITVATYPSKDGVAALQKAAREENGAKLGKTDDGAVLLIDPASPNNAHLAYRGANLQIEIYSPVPGEALRLAARGDVEPVP